MAYTTIDKPTDYFNTKLYTGTGSSLANTGVGFQSDFTWIKGRSGATEHVLTDAVRGVTKELNSNDDTAEETVAQGLTAFGSDGFTVGTDASYNTSSATYASWNWKANGAGATNEDGSINTTKTSASTTSGFSISTYTGNGTSGATIGHGLGVVPKMIVVKCRSAAGEDWMVYHEALGNTKHMSVNTTAASATATTSWNDTSPTTTLFSLGSNGKVNGSSKTYVAYCFAEKQGFSKIGSYIGNGNANGTFVYTGFKPAWIMIKSATTVESWMLFDNKRLGFNPDNDYLLAEGTDVEPADEEVLDIVSNGFKPRVSAGTLGTSGQTYIYMAFAEEPLVTSTGIPATAR
mgnify:CR=1 FL=1